MRNLRKQRSEKLEMVKYLIRAKADLNATDGIGQTALMRAAALGHSEVVAELLRAKANPDLTDGYGHTAREIAEENGQAGVVQLFSGTAQQAGQ